VRTLDRYLLSEMILPFITGIFAIIVMLVGNTLFQLVDEILKNNIPLEMVGRLIAYNIPALVVLTLPVGVAISAAFAVNRLARDSELTAIRMAGVPLRRIFLPIFAVGAIVSAVSLWLGDQIVPPAERAFARTQAEMVGFAIANSPSLVSNRVFTYQDYSFYVRSAQEIDSRHPDVLAAQGVTIFKSAAGPKDFPVIITAQSATYDHGVWTLKKPLFHLLDSAGYTSAEFGSATGTLNLRIPMPNVDPDQSVGFAGTSDNYNMADLRQQIALLVSTGQNATKLEVDYQFKMALPFLCLAFALCAPPLALRFARAGSFMGIFLSIVMVFVAWNTLLLTKAFGVSGHLDPFLAAWAPDILFAGIGLYLLRQAE
jgi:lipopolysaccharide export system permease protein